MASTKSRARVGRNKDYSVSRKLRKDGKSSEEFEAILSALTMEEIIALRLELAARLSKGKLYGIFLWKKLPDVIKEAVIKAALSITSTKKDAYRLLGLSEKGFKEINTRYNTDNYFNE